MSAAAIERARIAHGFFLWSQSLVKLGRLDCAKVNADHACNHLVDVLRFGTS